MVVVDNPDYTNKLFFRAYTVHNVCLVNLILLYNLRVEYMDRINRLKYQILRGLEMIC